MKVPADVYARSSRVYRGLGELPYPFHDGTFTVTQYGRSASRAEGESQPVMFQFSADPTITPPAHRS